MAKVRVLSQNGEENEQFIEPGETVGQLVRKVLGESFDSTKWLVRVAGNEARAGDVLTDGSRVTIVARKVAGA